MEKYYNNRTITVILHDALMVLVAWILAYFFRFSFIVSPEAAQIQQAKNVFYLLFPMQLFFNFYFGLYRGVWRFASIPDLVRILKAVSAGCIATVICLFIFTRLVGIPRAIFPLYGILLVGLLTTSRLCYRYFKDRYNLNSKHKNVLVVGAGNAGEILARNLLCSTNHDYRVVAFVDDARSKQGKEIQGVRVVGKCIDIGKVVKNKEISLVIIAIPSAVAEEMRKIVSYCREANIKFKTLPGLNELISDNITINEVRDVTLEDLLGREEVNIDFAQVKNAITDKAILVSGGGGSIGSAICRKLAKLQPKVLAIIESSEVNVFNITREMSATFPDVKFIPYLGSITDKILVKRILDQIKPEMVFHAAAYKHVPILEAQIYSAVHNNIIGTKVLVDLAAAAQVKKFILISTDKAVNPSSVMGRTKRIAELICQKKNNKHEENSTKFIIVRFGNVLGSSGSVVPIFKQQVANGGPVTVTHPEMTRFFMTIPEAARLILQACVLGNGGETFVLDMGEPVRIRYLAEQVIRLLGKEPELDVKIVYSGLRPGEKLHEELFYQHEKVMLTQHKKIFQAKIETIYHDIEQKVEQIATLLQQGTEHELCEFLNLLGISVPNE